MARNAALTRRQLIDCFRPYRDAFPDWSVEHEVMLTRRRASIRQVIDFQALGFGAYRPLHSISVELSIPDGASVLHGFLDGRHKVVRLREHAANWPRVIKAMEEQFLPSITAPLDASEVLRLAEEEVERHQIENIQYLAALAALNADLGRVDRALHWCGQIMVVSGSLGRPLADWEVRKRDYTIGLEKAIDAREVDVYLASSNGGDA